MSSRCSSVGLRLAALTVASLLLAAGPAFTQITDLIFQVRDTTAYPNNEGMLSIYMGNGQDTVVGFDFWLQLDRPDLIEFQLDSGLAIDTTYYDCLEWDGPVCIDSVVSEWFYACTEWEGDSCIDSVYTPGDPGVDWDFLVIDTSDILTGNFDTTGCLISGWELVETRCLGGAGYDLQVTALADLPPAPITPGIAPQGGELPLIRLPFNVKDVPDSLTDRVATVIPSLGCFAKPDGQCIDEGIFIDTTYDTTYYLCLVWYGDICMAWEEVSGPPYDSMAVDTHVYIDTGIVVVIPGHVTILSSCVELTLPGDVNGNGSLDIADMPLLIDFVYHGSPPLPQPHNADVNGDCCINWDDVSLLQAGGPYAECTCPEPIWCCCRGHRGNIDYDQDDHDNITDLTYLVAYLFGGGAAPWCLEEADFNLDGTVNITDLTYFVAYLFGGGSQPPSCPDYHE